MDVQVQEESKFALPLPFYSIWAINRVEDAYPQSWEKILFTYVLVKILIFSGNILKVYLNQVSD
jgi:hypothetical protein